MKSFDMAKLLGIADLPKYVEQIEAELQKTLPSKDSSMREPIEAMLSARSKRVRPTLEIAVVASQGKPIDRRVIAGCAAIELVHLASLVHDDIMDHAENRWNMPTVYKKHGINAAILVGDFLFARAMEEAATAGDDAAKAVAAAYAAMCEGQAKETSDLFNTKRTGEHYIQTIKNKTGSLTAAACHVGALCAGLKGHQLEAVVNYGESFGVSFQIIDDVLDITSTDVLMGKPVGNDMKEGVYTLPVIHSLTGQHSEELKDFFKHPAENTGNIMNILKKDGSIEESINTARQYNKSASEALLSIGGNKILNNLAKLPDDYLDWALDNLVLK